MTGIKSFSDNVSVSSSLNYRVTISERGLRMCRLRSLPHVPSCCSTAFPPAPDHRQPHCRFSDGQDALILPRPRGPSDMVCQPLAAGALGHRRPTGAGSWWTRSEADRLYIDRNFPRTWLPYVIEG